MNTKYAKIRSLNPLCLLGVLTYIFFFLACRQSTSEPNGDAELNSESTFDEILATECGADDYGMKSYVVAILKEGPNRDQGSITAHNLQRAHLGSAALFKVNELHKMIVRKEI